MLINRITAYIFSFLEYYTLFYSFLLLFIYSFKLYLIIIHYVFLKFHHTIFIIKPIRYVIFHYFILIIDFHFVIYEFLTFKYPVYVLKIINSLIITFRKPLLLFFLLFSLQLLI